MASNPELSRIKVAGVRQRDQIAALGIPAQRVYDVSIQTGRGNSGTLTIPEATYNDDKAFQAAVEEFMLQLDKVHLMYLEG